MLISCSPERSDLRPYDTPDMVTELGINIWLDGQDSIVDPDEVDQYFLDTVEELGYGTVPIIDLIISQTICREYPDGLTYCGFTEPGYPYMLAGLYSPPRSIKIHLMSGEEIDPAEQWTFKQSAFPHKIEHHVKYWYDDDDWNVNEVKNTPANSKVKKY